MKMYSVRIVRMFLSLSGFQPLVVFQSRLILMLRPRIFLLHETTVAATATLNKIDSFPSTCDVLVSSSRRI